MTNAKEMYEAGLLTADEYASRVLSDPSTSYWLKKALVAMAQRDPLDALADAELLADVMKAKADELLRKTA